MLLIAVYYQCFVIRGNFARYQQQFSNLKRMNLYKVTNAQIQIQSKGEKFLTPTKQFIYWISLSDIQRLTQHHVHVI